MTDVKWIKLSVNMFNDEKIKLIRTMPEGDKIIVTWVQLLCLAGKTNDGGGIYMGQNIYYTDEMLATLCDQPVNIMRIALKTLQQFGMIEWIDNGLIQITNWEKHQSTDKMSRMKEQTRIRQQKYYYRNKLRELGYEVDKEGFTDDLDELKTMADEAEEPNVRLTLANDTEVRSKKKEERSKKKEVNKPSSAELTEWFEKVWSYYPRKEGKSKSKSIFMKEVKAAENPEAMYRKIGKGVYNYAEMMEAEERDRTKIKMGSVFFNNKSWEDEDVMNYHKPKKKVENKLSMEEALRQKGGM